MRKKLRLLAVEVDQFTRYVLADTVKVRQVLINLLANAVQCTNQLSATVRMDSRRVDDAERLVHTFDLVLARPPAPGLSRAAAGRLPDDLRNDLRNDVARLNVKEIAEVRRGISDGGP